jgi:hypothetical protein
MRQRWQPVSIPAFLLSIALATGCGDGIGPETHFLLTGRWAGADWVGSAEALLAGGASGADTLYLFAARPPTPGYLRKPSVCLFPSPGREGIR